MRSAAILRALALAGVTGALASCSSFSPPPIVTATKEFFSPDRYGAASPKVVEANQYVPKGGGHYMVGDPYRVAGRTYVPRDNPRYSKVGLASWYGSAFHGRLTANGEVYDVNGLTAAHPTLPLPSYVRVTNIENGRSLVVRVNDRGPFAQDRLIDVSARAATLLGFRQQGTAQVRVDYVGPAQMDGRDERRLLASYQGPDVAPWQGRSFADNSRATAGMMIASAAPAAPRLRPAVADSDPMTLTPTYVTTAAYAPEATDNLGALILRSGLTRSYAETPPPTAAQAAAAEFSSHDLTTALTAAAARRASELRAGGGMGAPVTIQLGSFSTPENAERIAAEFGRFGETAMQTREIGGRILQVVMVTTDRSVAPQAVIDAAAAEGLTGAFIVAR